MIDELERPHLRGRGRRRLPPKRVGEVGEASFLPKMLRVGFGVAKPWGDSDLYDYILDSGWKRWRTQVKCTETNHDDGYQVLPCHRVYGKGRTLYTPEDIDLLVVYIIPSDVWYVFPIETIIGVRTLILFPDEHHARAKWEAHREAWYLLQQPCPQEIECPRQGLCQGLNDWRKCFLQGVGLNPNILE